jgi:hypothetical protein
MYQTLLLSELSSPAAAAVGAAAAELFILVTE